jgi:hypothetical protein
MNERRAVVAVTKDFPLDLILFQMRAKNMLKFPSQTSAFVCPARFIQTFFKRISWTSLLPFHGEWVSVSND